MGRIVIFTDKDTELRTYLNDKGNCYIEICTGQDWNQLECLELDRHDTIALIATLEDVVYQMESEEDTE